jgi:putative ABC transport system substrate-binding protein
MRGIKRREFIALLGGAAAWRTTARTQQSTIPIIGFLGTGSAAPYASRVKPLSQ